MLHKKLVASTATLLALPALFGLATVVAGEAPAQKALTAHTATDHGAIASDSVLANISLVTRGDNDTTNNNHQLVGDLEFAVSSGNITVVLQSMLNSATDAAGVSGFQNVDSRMLFSYEGDLFSFKSGNYINSYERSGMSASVGRLTVDAASNNSNGILIGDFLADATVLQTAGTATSEFVFDFGEFGFSVMPYATTGVGDEDSSLTDDHGITAWYETGYGDVGAKIQLSNLDVTVDEGTTVDDTQWSIAASFNYADYLTASIRHTSNKANDDVHKLTVDYNDGYFHARAAWLDGQSSAATPVNMNGDYALMVEYDVVDFISPNDDVKMNVFLLHTHTDAGTKSDDTVFGLNLSTVTS